MNPLDTFQNNREIIRLLNQPNSVQHLGHLITPKPLLLINEKVKKIAKIDFTLVHTYPLPRVTKFAIAENGIKIIAHPDSSNEGDDLEFSLKITEEKKFNCRPAIMIYKKTLGNKKLEESDQIDKVKNRDPIYHFETQEEMLCETDCSSSPAQNTAAEERVHLEKYDPETQRNEFRLAITLTYNEEDGKEIEKLIFSAPFSLYSKQKN